MNQPDPVTPAPMPAPTPEPIPYGGLLLFGDTETTGFKKKGDLVQDGQARVCQLGLLLTDIYGNTIGEFSCLIQPDGMWEMNAGAQAIHGISTEMCYAQGVSLHTAITVYHSFKALASKVIAHNAAFDSGMMEVEEAYLARRHPVGPSIPLEWHCTMLEAKPICKLPGKYGDYKWPKLEEAMQIILGRGLGDNAHDAMHDVRGCRDLYFGLRGREQGINTKVPKAEVDDIPQF